MKVQSIDFDIEEPEFTVSLPIGTQILTASIEGAHHTARLWIMFDPNQPLENRKFYLATTSRKVICDTPDVPLRHVASFAPPQSSLYFHLFEKEDAPKTVAMYKEHAKDFAPAALTGTDMERYLKRPGRTAKKVDEVK